MNMLADIVEGFGVIALILTIFVLLEIFSMYTITQFL